MSETVIVIGAGHGGAQAVEALRSGGFAGRVILIGDEAHRPYERPATSKELLSRGMELDRVFLKREGYYPDKDIEVRLSTTVTAIDRDQKTVTLADGETLSYDKLIIATGMRPRPLQVPGADLKGVFTLRSLADSLALGEYLGPGKKIVVIGGGYVGLEVAASATKLGSKATVIEMQERLLGRVVAAEIAAFFDHEHRAAGVDIRYGVVIEKFIGEAGSVKAVRLTDGTEIAADAVVIGIGGLPNTELASAAGLPVENGIVVDEFGQTPDPSVFAVGDATNHPNSLLGKRLRLESVPAAMGQARAVASVICGNPKPYVEMPWFWSDQYDIKLQIAGLSEVGDRVVLRGNPADRKFAAYYLREGVVVAVNAINSAKDFIGGRKLVNEGRKADPARLADLDVPLAEV